MVLAVAAGGKTYARREHRLLLLPHCGREAEALWGLWGRLPRESVPRASTNMLLLSHAP